MQDKAGLIRLCRTAEGWVEPDLLGRRGGRGAYLCPDERCLREAEKKGRLARAFRAPASLRPGTRERLPALFAARREEGSRPGDPGGGDGGGRSIGRER
ncbi:MAG: YlxR family protein [Candidatus Rokubacteria bacterium]|nr:YlxR family protein [Candidatus Rokubacteria bacterium]